MYGGSIPAHRCVYVGWISLCVDIYIYKGCIHIHCACEYVGTCMNVYLYSSCVYVGTCMNVYKYSVHECLSVLCACIHTS